MNEVVNDWMAQWYSRADVKFEIISFLKNREFAALVPKGFADTKMDFNYLSRDYPMVKEMGRASRRYLRCHNVQHFDYILLQILKIKRYPIVYNLYHSMAEYCGGIPKFHPNPALRNTSDWRKNHWRSMVGYDMLVDIDAGDFSDVPMARESAELIMNLFDDCKVPYELRFSGMGFHFIVPGEFFNDLERHYDPDKKFNLYSVYIQICKKLHDEYSEMVDWNLADSRRICKCPYTLACYPEKVNVCFPFIEKRDFYHFKLEDALVSNWTESLRGRGTKIFNKSEEYNPLMLLNKLKIDPNQDGE